MKANEKMIVMTRNVGTVILTIGTLIFLYGFFASDYSIITGIGIGTITGGIFVTLMGLFFVATEEMIENTEKGITIE